ncbi:MAG TPA: hypothetical protein VK879_00270 [Candidatus Sulfomarinibacteraceae bacterium]|nr:hypothetical protein [Candidatus Sulfomarinibacteraceae bacterium]
MSSAFPATSGPTSLFPAGQKRAERSARDEVPMNREVSKLLTAAVVSKAFCQLLLTNPAQALEDGYNGMRFALTNQEKELLLSIQATSLPELATQISSQNGNGVGQPSPLASPLMQV